MDEALDQPNGLLAVGGDLSVPRLLCAYRRGIFPWYSHGQPILWWCPDPRAVILPERLHVSRSLRKRLRQQIFSITANRCFAEVLSACAEPRRGQEGTWISDEMRDAYLRLHVRGFAHSLECWCEGRLAGGIYGVAIGSVFFGESMFSRVADASKVALVHLCERGFELIDCQVPNPHLRRMGAELIPRRHFIEQLARLCALPQPSHFQ